VGVSVYGSYAFFSWEWLSTVYKGTAVLDDTVLI